MVVEAGEVLKPFRTSNKRPTPEATTPRQRGPAPGHRTSLCQSLLSASPPSPAGSDGGSGLVPRSLLNPAVLTVSPRNPEALHGRHLINHCSNGSSSSSPVVLGHECHPAAARAYSLYNLYSRLPDWSKTKPGEGQLNSSGIQRYGCIPFGLPPMALCF